MFFTVPCYVYWTPAPFSSNFGGVRDLVFEAILTAAQL